MDLKEKYFTDKQVSLILNRALELQKKDDKSVQQLGLTPSDLEKIAIEAGIEQEYIRKAISEIDEGTLKRGKSFLQKFLGHKPRVILKKEIPVEIPVSEYENFLPIIQKAGGIIGNHNLLGKTFTWQADQAGMMVLHVMIVSKNGKTNIEIECNLSQTAGGLFGGLIGGLGVGTGASIGIAIGLAVLGSLLFTALVSVGSIGVSYLLARLIYNAIYKSYKKKMNKIIGELTKEIESR